MIQMLVTLKRITTFQVNWKNVYPLDLRPKHVHGKSSHTLLLLQKGKFLWYLVIQWQFINQSRLDLIICYAINIRSWNAHSKHLPSDSTYAECCELICFTETHVGNSCGYTPIDRLVDRWKDIIQLHIYATMSLL